MVISTRRSRAPATAAPSVAAAATSGTPACAREDYDRQGGEQQQQGDADVEIPATGPSTSTSSSETTQTPPVSSSTGGSVDVDVPVNVSDGSGDVVRRSGSNKRLRVVRSAPHGGEVTTSSAQQRQNAHTDARQDETMRDDSQVGSNEGDTTSQAAEWTEDPDMQQEILLRIADLSSKNQKLNADIELLKCNFTLRQAETNRLLIGMGALNKVETALSLLQREYRDCARNNVALIHDALRRISYCSSQLDTLTSGGNVTATQLQNFRHECSREMDDLLLKLEDVEAGQQSQQDQVDSNNLSTLGEIRRNRYEIEQLKQEISACKRFMSGNGVEGDEASAPGALQSPPAGSTKAPGVAGTGTDSELLSRIDHFSSQLENLHNEMAMLKQFLLQESNASRSGIEKLLSRQMNDFQEVQDDETKRLQDEMDELRSELCDVLKEMHLLKERTRYLRPDCSLKARKRPREESSKNRRQLQPQAAGSRYVAAGGGSTEMCSTCSSFIGGGGYSSVPSTRCSRAHCDHPHHCRYHCPVTAADTGHMDRGGECAYPRNLNLSPSRHNHSPSSSRSSSPRRPSDVVIQALQQQHADTGAQENQSCPSPHFSSRSSSISGRISVNRDENGEPLPEEEVERRLLEQHRLFWIKEGAGEAK